MKSCVHPMNKSTSEWRLLLSLCRLDRSCRLQGLARWTCRFAHDQLRFHCYLEGNFGIGRSELLEKQLNRQLAHLVKRLTNRRETRRLEGRLFDVVESDHRHILGHPQPAIMKRTNTTYRRNVVERHDSGKTTMMRQQLLHHRISQFRGR